MSLNFLAPIGFSLVLLGPSFAEVVINEFAASNLSTAVPNALPGTFEDWIELKNTGSAAVDLGGWHLTDNFQDLTQWTFPAATSLAPGQLLIVFASGQNQPDANGNLQTNFKLSKSGEYLGLFRPDGSVASSYGLAGVNYPAQGDDVTYGRHPTTGATVFFSAPTPGTENDAAGVARVAGLTASPKRGYFQAAQSVTLSTATAGATIHFTTDGTPPISESGTPATTSQAYAGPITIDQTTVLRVAATFANYSPSEIATHTYVLLDIDGAAANGADPAGLNAAFLQQTQPAGYGPLASGDYNMNTSVSRSTASSNGHGGSSVSQAMLQGMRDIPTISIALPKEDFAGDGGIYSNPQSEGTAWEKACSAEFIPATGDTRTDFQENCGLRVQGGASRVPAKSPKHSLSFRFREEYGAGRLKQLLFPGSKVANFNSIALRAGYNNSWIHSDSSQRARASMIRDQWMRDALRDMGNEDAGHGFLAHLFINGLYWGLHNVAERQDNVHYAQYHGGDPDLIDARNGAKYVEGNATSWNAMRATVASGDWEKIKQVLDVNAYIDFEIIQRYGANQDLKTDGNWRAAGGGPFSDATEMRPWKLYSWDGERVLEDPRATSIPLDPMAIRPAIQDLPEYRLRFADRARMHLTGQGALTPERCRARWEKYAVDLDKAIIAESARWGDHRQGSPYTRNSWLTEQNRLYNSYFPVRTANLLDRLVSEGLVDEVAEPEFRIDNVASEGGFVAPGATLSATGPDGVIYYTLDGSDPANEDGSVNPSALSLSAGFASQSAFPFESAGWQYLAGTTALSPSNVVVGNAAYASSDWKHPSFNDASWTPGTGLMAGLNAASINAATANTIIDIGPAPERYPTVYFRKSFTVTDANEVLTISGEVIRDDGVILYLNGREIFRENVGNGTVAYSDYTGTQADENEIPKFSYLLSPGELLEGNNVLAVEVHNANSGSSDLGLDVSLDLSRPVGAASIALTESSRLVARSRIAAGNGGFAWSAPKTATFLLEPAAGAGNLVISEINYHPREATLLEKKAALPLDLADGDLFEFIELYNPGAGPVNLSGLRFTSGIELELGLRAVAGGERVLLVRNVDAFLARYGGFLTDKIVGIYSEALGNAADILTLQASDGSLIDRISYTDRGPWPSRADGEGSTLERIDVTANADDSSNWTSSVAFHGSPGVAGALSDKRIVINEVSSNSANDYIEIYNTTAESIDLTGWVLSDSKDVYHSYQFPTTTLGAMSYLIIESSDYDAPANRAIGDYSGTSGAGPTTVTSIGHGLVTGDLITITGYGGFSAYNDSFEVDVLNASSFRIETPFLDNHATKGSWQRGRSFGLSGSKGDDLWLLETDDNGRPVAFVDHVEFAASAPGDSLGRWPDGEGYDTLFTMVSETKGTANAGPLLGPVYLSEIHYNSTLSTNDEFVEITNQGTSTVSLDQWRLRGGIDFDFTTAHSLPAGASLLVVGFDPAVEPVLAADFRSTFGIGATVVLIGPFRDGSLDDTKGTVRLQKAGPGPDFAQITADEVRYFATSPWPLAAAGAGSSLQRNPALTFGNFASSWNALLPSPGSVVSGETYATWAAGNGVGAGGDDPDDDGLSNHTEFALGSDPNARNSEPRFTMAGGQGTISFPVRLDRSGVNLVLETSTGLESWTPQTTSSGGMVGNLETREFQFSLADRPELYWRLRAIATP